MPETTMSGRSGRIFVSASSTQSVGVPSTVKRRSPIWRARSGLVSVNECAVALCSEAGATTVTSPTASSALANATIPSAKYPSSFVTNIFGIRLRHLHPSEPPKAIGTPKINLRGLSAMRHFSYGIWHMPYAICHNPLMSFNAPQSLTDPARVRRIVTQTVLVVAAAAAVIWLLYALRMILLLLAFTAIFCYLVAPLVEFFQFSIPVGRFV